MSEAPQIKQKGPVEPPWFPGPFVVRLKPPALRIHLYRFRIHLHRFRIDSSSCGMI